MEKNAPSPIQHTCILTEGLAPAFSCRSAFLPLSISTRTPSYRNLDRNPATPFLIVGSFCLKSVRDTAKMRNMKKGKMKEKPSWKHFDLTFHTHTHTHTQRGREREQQSPNVLAAILPVPLLPSNTTEKTPPCTQNRALFSVSPLNLPLLHSYTPLSLSTSSHHASISTCLQATAGLGRGIWRGPRWERCSCNWRMRFLRCC